MREKDSILFLLLLLTALEPATSVAARLDPPEGEACVATITDVAHAEVRLPRPVDWITGKVGKDLAASKHADIHAKFFQRNKFNQLTTSNLTEIEARIREALSHPVDAVDADVLRFELATILVQNHPSKTRALEALAQVEKSLAGQALSAELRYQADQVRTLAKEILEETAEHPPLKQVNWAISNQCPLCCKGCYFNFRSTEMTLEHAKIAAAKLRSEGVEEIILTGGDPLLSPHFPDYVEMLHAMGFKVAVDTTGYTLTEETAKRLAGKLSFVGLPLDGATQEVVASFRKGQDDTLERVRAAIGLLKKYGIPVKVNTTVTRKNIDSLAELAKMIDENGYSSDWGWSVFQWWDTRAEAKMLEEYAVTDERFLAATAALRKVHPNLNIRVGSIDSRSRQYFEIMTNGDVLNYSDGATPGSIILGNILTEPVADLRNSPALSHTSSKFKTWFHLHGGIPGR